MEILLQAGANPNILETGNTWDLPILNISDVFWSKKQRAFEAMTILLDHGADLGLFSQKDGVSNPLHGPSASCQFDGCLDLIVRIATLAPFMLNLENHYGFTSLCLAAENDNDIGVGGLLLANADARYKCWRGEYKTPYQYTKPGSKTRGVFEEFGIHE